MAEIMTKAAFCETPDKVEAKETNVPLPIPGEFYWYRWADKRAVLRYCIFRYQHKTEPKDDTVMIDPATGQIVGGIHFCKSRVAAGDYVLAADVLIVTPGLGPPKGEEA